MKNIFEYLRSGRSKLIFLFFAIPVISFNALTFLHDSLLIISILGTAAKKIEAKKLSTRSHLPRLGTNLIKLLHFTKYLQTHPKVNKQ